MRLFCLGFVVFYAVTAPSAIADDTASLCDLAQVRRIDELQDALQRRAVEAVNLAASDIESGRLRQLVEPSATFSSGGGDVGLPLGTGLSGVHSLARYMSADTYRFLHWDYMPSPVSDPCGAHDVDVEFVRSADHELFPVRFSFKFGRIVKVVGWSRTFSTGTVDLIHN